MKKITIAFMLCLIFMTGCKQSTNEQNKFPYLDQWIENISDTKILKYQFNSDGTVRVNIHRDRCCTTAIQGEYQIIDNVIHIQYNSEASSLDEEISFFWVDNVLTLEIDETDLIFTKKE